MTEGIFGDLYASVYDALYADKDYEAECDVVEAAFALYGDGPLRSILDLGCGTGSHALPLRRRGYDVVGVDRSDEMLSAARAKLAAENAEAFGGRLELIRGDVRTVRVPRQFDALVMMFAVLGYQTTTPDVDAALQVVRRHLRSGGLFLADVWFGPAVLAAGPDSRTRTVPHEGHIVTRNAEADLDTENQLCTVRYRVAETGVDSPSKSGEEVHVMRYFFRDELEHLLRNAGLELLALTAFPDLDSPASEETWNAFVVAR